MEKSVIINEIETKANFKNYSIWRIGLTHDTNERKEHWGVTVKLDVSQWYHWEADSLKDAQEIESMFTKKGMQGGTGGNLSANKTVYIYVF